MKRKLLMACLTKLSLRVCEFVSLLAVLTKHYFIEDILTRLFSICKNKRKLLRLLLLTILSLTGQYPLILLVLQ